MGPVREWPSILVTLVDLVLASQTMMCVMWGRLGVMIYNDAYAQGIRDRHPSALGRSAFETWADVRDSFEPSFEQALAGKEPIVRGVPLAFSRPGLPDWSGVYDLTYTPVRDPGARVVGVLAQVRDVTEVAEARQRERELEKRQAFLLRLTDAMRPVAEPDGVQSEACRLLAEELDVDRVYYVEIDEAAGVARVGRDHVRHGAPSLAGTHPVPAFAWSLDLLRAGSHLIADTRTSPLVKADRLVGAL